MGPHTEVAYLGKPHTEVAYLGKPVSSSVVWDFGLIGQVFKQWYFQEKWIFLEGRISTSSAVGTDRLYLQIAVMRTGKHKESRVKRKLS